MVTAPKPDPANYRLSVRDFGPIVEADVDFRPLTVFVGPSNTGKSYLATLAYALHQFLRDPYPYSVFHQQEILDSWMRYQRYLDKMEMSEADAVRFRQWARVNFADGTAVDWEDIEDIVRIAIDLFFDGTGNWIFDQIKRYFGVDSISMFPRIGSKSSASVRIYGDDGISFDIEIQEGGQRFLSIPRLPQISHDPRDTLWMEMNEIIQQGTDVDTAKFGIKNIVSSIVPRLFGDLNQSSYYLPSGRSGIMQAHRTVASALVQNAQYAGIRSNERIILLSGVSGDFLQYLLAIDPSRHLQFRDTASSLEKQVLKGDIRIVPTEAGYPDFRYHPEGWKGNLPLMNASSMVSELASVVLFFRHIIQPNSVLIIDEPEAHLHPAMQVEFTRLLAGAVNAGLRVILTTHSEWVVETVGNLVELSKVPKAQRAGLDGGPYVLPEEHVGVWLFRQKKRPRGSVVEEVPHDPETGTYGTGYNAVAMALHNEWADAASSQSG